MPNPTGGYMSKTKQHIKTLNDVKVGDGAIVKSIGCSGIMKRRLIDMGITPGVSVKIKKLAPLGDPMEIELRCYELSIRRSEASEIFVEQ